MMQSWCSVPLKFPLKFHAEKCSLPTGLLLVWRAGSQEHSNPVSLCYHGVLWIKKDLIAFFYYYFLCTFFLGTFEGAHCCLFSVVDPSPQTLGKHCLRSEQSSCCMCGQAKDTKRSPKALQAN